MQQIFLTQPNFFSPRWQQAFPRARVIDCAVDLPSVMSNTLLWLFYADTKSLATISSGVALGASVIALTSLESPSQAKQVLEQGARGYCHYLAAEPVLTQVSQVVQLGGLWLGADLMRQLVYAAANILEVAHISSSSVLDVLTLREKSVAQSVAAGKSNKEIARDLDITERTVKAHLSSVFEKLNVRDRLQLVLIMAEKTVNE